MNLRERTEAYEAEYLSPYAAQSAKSLGRAQAEEACDIRTDFQRDRDRITHSKSFRRLMHKTQVFISPEGDHYRTRLTHTLEVTQISRTIARALRLNEDLTEAIALGHDLGHTPFGHTGEEALDVLLEEGFRHNEQSVRVVTKLEKNGQGLNLTAEVLDGIENHRGVGKPSTMEGKIVQISDKIAYINHDIDDAIRADIIKQEELPKGCLRVLGQTSSQRIDFLIRAVIAASEGQNDILLDNDARTALQSLRTFMFDAVYASQLQKKERSKIRHMLSEMFLYYCCNLHKLPEVYYNLIEQGEKPERVVCDYIAGMTDRFAMNQFMQIYVPAGWNM